MHPYVEGIADGLVDSLNETDSRPVEIFSPFDPRCGAFERRLKLVL
jgi:hypothetical protein